MMTGLLARRVALVKSVHCGDEAAETVGKVLGTENRKTPVDGTLGQVQDGVSQYSLFLSLPL